MKSKAAFTRKDLVVVLGCVVFLLMSLGAIGSGGRRRAKEAVCLSNLRQWGVMFQKYTQDNDGYLMPGWQGSAWAGPDDMWIGALRRYYGNDPKICCCPTATKPRHGLDSNGDVILWGGPGANLGTFSAWGLHPATSFWEEGDYGSYGMNEWAYNPSPVPWGPGVNWRTVDVKGADQIPLFLDCYRIDVLPLHSDQPRQYEDDFSSGVGEMDTVCLNRHNGYINGLFLDWSVRKIGLKELWELKWHRNWYTNPATGEYSTDPPDWPDWMRKFKDYAG